MTYVYSSLSGFALPQLFFNWLCKYTKIHHYLPKEIKWSQPLFEMLLLVPMLVFLLALKVEVTQGARILGWFFYPSISHQIVFQPIWRELSLRGHQVTVVTIDPLKDSTLVNLTEIDVHHTYNLLESHRMDNIISKDSNSFAFLQQLYALLDKMLEDQMDNSQVKTLITSNAKFDLILTECFHPVLYALSAKYNAPVIGVSSLGLTIVGYQAIGNPVHPVLFPDLLFGFHGQEWTILEKIRSCLHHLWYTFFYNYIYMPRADRMARKYFGENIPYLASIERNVSLVFVNINPLLNTIMPNVPAIVQLGQMHIQTPKPLPDDLNKILDDAKEGAIYFSLGTNVKSVNMAEKLRNNIIEALAELPYTILWKWESDHLPGKPPNVVTKKWLPQQDVLAHPNIKAFVTQGGLQSIEEAISRSVPLVAMPFMSDQPMNVRKLVDLGVAVKVDPATVTKEQLKAAIIEVAENEKYRQKIKEMQYLLQDQSLSGLERAVWWSEYVIRHKGAKHLRSPTVDVSWYHYYLLDVIGVILLVIFSTVYVVFKIVIKITSYPIITKLKQN